jgi:hypothetical protein
MISRNKIKRPVEQCGDEIAKQKSWYVFIKALPKWMLTRGGHKNACQYHQQDP